MSATPISGCVPPAPATAGIPVKGGEDNAPVGRATVLARMYRGPDGLFLGHARGIDGKIVGNTRWVKISSVGSRLLTSAGMITGHLMLVEISNKLDRVQKD